MPAVILKVRDFKDYDRRLTVFSKELGKLRLIARGARKPQAKLGSYLNLFNLVDLEIAGKTIIGAELIDPQFKLRENLDALENALYIAEMVDEFVPLEAPEEKIFALIAGWPKKEEFENEFLKILGFAGVKTKNLALFLTSRLK